MKTKVDAFTLLELVIAMLLSALVIGITYSAYTITGQTYQRFRQQNDTSQRLILLDELLAKDISRADTVYHSADGLLIRRDSTLITYTIDSSRVIRSAGRIDTFHMPVKGANYLFEQQPVTFLPPLQEADRIDEIYFIITWKKRDFVYHYHKDYSSADLITRNTHALN